VRTGLGCAGDDAQLAKRRRQLASGGRARAAPVGSSAIARLESDAGAVVRTKLWPHDRGREPSVSIMRGRRAVRVRVEVVRGARSRGSGRG